MSDRHSLHMRIAFGITISVIYMDWINLLGEPFERQE